MNKNKHHFRFHHPHLHLTSAFGDDWFGLKAELFARFFGTPTFIIGQTVVVLVWVLINVLGYTSFDIYPFILLNLAFSLQAAYAAPLILLAQTRQADRDNHHTEADALHREDLARANEERQTASAEQSAQLLVLIATNLEMTQTINKLTNQVVALTNEIHKTVVDHITPSADNEND